ncbi:iron reductase domain protein [Sporormia fimetaria CBS 119925]|uniref:Iron reductase domain protein n=1 Tax=Sporormia fimetaria CBS 119925 TaxID=1340428 RepID=A0A6A6UZV6_9PLEO|nr:iron reductase domain protein [Sporormia fimetaria CBS 119925]
MRPSTLLTVIPLLTTGTALGGSTQHHDADTNLTYSSITHPNGFTYRIALPSLPSTSDTNHHSSDSAILQIIAPHTLSWCGLAWGGRMIGNPLSVFWPTGASTGLKAIVSSRIASGKYLMPTNYSSAAYTYLNPTTANETHWTVTVLCQGCTRWNIAGQHVDLTESIHTNFGFACSKIKPTTPASNMSFFGIHEQYGVWEHDWSLGRNERFEEAVRGNLWVGDNGEEVV